MKYSKQLLGILGLTVMALFIQWSNPTQAAAAEGPDIQVEDEEVERDFLRYETGKGLRVGDKVTFFGYGELHYNNVIGSSGDKFDFHRFVIGLGIDFTDWLVFRSEIDFEHAATELELEIAYLDFLIHELFNVRTGIILTPVGFLNEHHEPTLFYSVERPQFNTVIIPTTWFGAGVGFHGKTDFGLHYQAYLMESLDAINESNQTGGFRGSKGLRSARRKTAEAPGRDVAGVVRLEYKGMNWFQVGTSFWLGNTSQGNAAVDGGLTSVIESDLRFQFEGLELTFVGAWIHIQNADQINAAIQAVDPATPFTDLVGTDILGGYAEIAYHLFHHLWPSTTHDLVVFARHERFDTQFRMPTGATADSANKRHTTTFGLAYFPIDQVAIKVDYNVNRNSAGTANDQFNAGFAFHY